MRLAEDQQQKQLPKEEGDVRSNRLSSAQMVFNTERRPLSAIFAAQTFSVNDAALGWCETPPVLRRCLKYEYARSCFCLRAFLRERPSIAVNLISV